MEAIAILLGNGWGIVLVLAEYTYTEISDGC